MYTPFKPYLHHRPERDHAIPSDDGNHPDDAGAEWGSEAAEAAVAEAHAYRDGKQTGSKSILNSIDADEFFLM